MSSSSLVKYKSNFALTEKRLSEVLKNIKQKLEGKVNAIYVFGSASTGEYTESSDIDLIIIDDKAKNPFIQRALNYPEVFDIYPNVDLLVYTQQEFDEQMANSKLGFWKSVKESLKPL